MEPRPSRPNRPAGGSSRVSQRPPWTPPEEGVDPTLPRPPEAQAPPAGSTSHGGPWYGPYGSLGPEPPEYRMTRPPMPIKPRGERGNRWLRYLVVVLLLVIVVGGSAFAATRCFGGNDDGGTGETAQVATAPTEQAGAAAGEATPGTDADAEQEQAEPTPTPEQSEPTPTEEVAAESNGAEEGQDEPAAPVQPTQPVAAAAQSESQSGSAARTADSYLPDAADLDGSWDLSIEGERTREEVGAQLGDDGVDLLLSWRWRENIYRDFMRANPEAASDDTDFLSVSVHRFGTADGAVEALDYLADIVVTAQGLEDLGDVGVGDSSRGLQGPGEGANLYVLYVQDGNIVIRLGGSSSAGDPAAFVNQVAEQLVAG
jgi:hypothetical protein